MVNILFHIKSYFYFSSDDIDECAMNKYDCIDAKIYRCVNTPGSYWCGKKTLLLIFEKKTFIFVDIGLKILQLLNSIFFVVISYY